MLARAKGKRGSVRVRYCIEWSDRSRLLKYPTSIGMTFVVPFKQNNFMRDAEFAVQGRFDNPAKFDGKIFATHLRDLKTIVENCLEVRGKKITAARTQLQMPLGALSDARTIPRRYAVTRA